MLFRSDSQLSFYLNAAKARGELPSTNGLVFSGSLEQQIAQKNQALTGFKEEARASEDMRRLEEQKKRDDASLAVIDKLNQALNGKADKTDALVTALGNLTSKNWDVNVFVDGRARQPVPAY